MCVCLPYVLFLFPSRYTTSFIRLHTYVHGRTIKQASTATSGHAFPQEKLILLCRMVYTSRCASSLNVTSVDYVCRRIEEVVYLEGKGKRILFLIPSRYTTSSIRLHTYVHGRTIKRASTANRVHALHTGKAHSSLQNGVRYSLWKLA